DCISPLSQLTISMGRGWLGCTLSLFIVQSSALRQHGTRSNDGALIVKYWAVVLQVFEKNNLG
ncbi:MAG: hypothetical protein ACN6OP_25610, partial [Pseudomonadales bacterium]